MKKILIFGSCVSRDILRLNSDRFTTTHYIARQSLISAYSPPFEMPDSLRFKSKFLQRSIRGDFNSDAIKRIQFHAQNSDLLLIDFATERRGYLPIRKHSLLPAGNRSPVISFSREVATSNISKILPINNRVKFGSGRHFSRFTKSALKLREDLQKMNLFDRTIVIRVPFVDQSNSGLSVPQVHKLPGEKWNQLFIPYYDYLEGLGFKVTEALPSKYAVADANHKWGIGPDHYIPGAYNWWANELSSSGE